VNDWLGHRKTVYAAAKLLVVAPNIELAELYLKWLTEDMGLPALIATSKDDDEAATNIDRFKGLKKPASDILVSVGMAYEGLSVPEATILACLTHIRSVPWLEQCFARLNRLAPGKRYGVVYAPKDVNFTHAIRQIEMEQLNVLREKDKKKRQELLFDDGEEREDLTRYLESGIIGEVVPVEIAPATNVVVLEQTPTEIEEDLRKEIQRYISKFVKGKPYGQKQVNHRIKEVFGKGRGEMTIPELKSVMSYLRNIYR
jgi:superfamily II DNA or RNA helicase